MTIEDIVIVFNDVLQEYRKTLNIDCNNHIVVQRKVTTNSTFKAYKNYDTILWYINGKDKYELISSTCNFRITNEAEKTKALDLIDSEICKSLFSLVGTEIYNLVIKGEFYGY